MGTSPSALTRDCFDPAMAHFPTRLLPIEQVVDPLHVTHAPGTVEQYRAAMLRGDRFPPIAVVRLGSRFYVADGHKRFTAYSALPVDSILVEHWPPRQWLRDQWRQFTRKSRQQASLLRRSLNDRAARQETARLARSTARHWRRIALSLMTAPKNPRAE